MGCVYRQKGRSVYLIKYYRDGVPIIESSGTDIKDDARSILREREGDIAKGQPITKRSRKVRFEDLADDIKNEYKSNGRASLSHLERRIDKHLRPFFAGRRMADVTTSDVRKFIAERKEAGASNAEINRELAVLKRMYTLARQAEILRVSPYIPSLDERNARQGFFERDQFEVVRRHLAADLQGVATFAYITGWRVPSEVLALQWAQVNQDEGIIRLEPNTTKNREAREFPYLAMDELADVITDQWKLRPKDRICPWVFHRDGVSFLDERGAASHVFYREWRKACTDAGCGDRIPHDFRRTAVRNLVRAGNSEKVAMLLTGHKTREVFDRYDIVNHADLTAAVTRLAEAPIHRAPARGRVLKMRRKAAGGRQK